MRTLQNKYILQLLSQLAKHIHTQTYKTYLKWTFWHNANVGMYTVATAKEYVSRYEKGTVWWRTLKNLTSRELTRDRRAHPGQRTLLRPCRVISGNCVVPAVRVRTLGSVGSRTQVSLRCNFSDYVLRNNYMFRPMVAIFRLSWEYVRDTVSYIARIM